MTNQSMHPNQSSYNLWTWLIAILLALFLLWKLMSGAGPSGACCAAPVAPVEAVAPAAVATAEPAAEAFGFTSTCNEFSNKGDAASMTWVAKADGLKSMLCGGEGLKAEGDGKNVVLTGVVDTDATRTKIGDDAKAFFGADVNVDNQITVKAAEPVAAVEPAAAPVAAPPAAKLYFATARTNQPNDSAEKLTPIVEWLKANPNAKAVVSGFHDPRGGAAVNARLAKGRAESTQAALVAAGVDAARIEMREPADENGGSDLQEARRVEVSVE
jgi:outer membrane protein OmpA-like peptidoglycan-associated protein